MLVIRSTEHEGLHRRHERPAQVRLKTHEAHVLSQVRAADCSQMKAVSHARRRWETARSAVEGA